MKHQKHQFFYRRKNQRWRSLATLFLLTSLLFFNCKEDTLSPDVFGSLSGQVLLEADNSPVAGAIVSTTPASSTVQTDASGNFVFENIKEGSFTIRAEAADLVTTTETVTIFENETTSVVLLMSEPTVVNSAPNAPKAISPTDGAVNVPISVELSWEATDPDENDALSFDFCLFNGNVDADTIKFNGLSESTVNVGGLRYGSTYFWQVSVSDGTAEPVFSEVFRFTTEGFPDHRFVFSKIQNGVYEIYSAGQISETPYQLTMGGSNFRPRFSPVGGRIAFINSNFPTMQLFVMDRDGENQALVQTPVPIDGENPFELDFCWSPDGTKLLYMNEERLFKINIDGTGAVLLAELNGEEFIEVDWNGPTGKIAARTVGTLPYESRILLYNEDGTFEEEIIPDVPGSIGGPSFSVDGQFLLYTRDTSGFESPDGRQLESHVFLHEIATGVEQDLSANKPNGFNDLDARFSPNGAFVIFAQSNNTLGSQKDIYLMNLEGEARTLLFENAEMPDWWE